MEYAREEIELALAQQRQRKLGLDMELEKGTDPDLIAENVERCDAQIAVLEAQLEKLPPAPVEPTIDEKAADLAAQRKEAALVAAKAAQILKDDPEYPDDLAVAAPVIKPPKPPHFSSQTQKLTHQNLRNH